MNLKVLNEYIKSFPWHHIEKAMGNCQGIDKDVINLISDDLKIRDMAYWKLDNHIVLQGGVW